MLYLPYLYLVKNFICVKILQFVQSNCFIAYVQLPVDVLSALQLEWHQNADILERYFPCYFHKNNLSKAHRFKYYVPWLQSHKLLVMSHDFLFKHMIRCKFGQDWVVLEIWHTYFISGQCIPNTEFCSKLLECNFISHYHVYIPWLK